MLALGALRYVRAMTQDLRSRYRMLKEEGVNPEAAYRTARRDGLGIAEALDAIGAAYGLSAIETYRLAGAEEGMERAWPPIDSGEALLATLRRELGYCDCAPEQTLPALRDFLRAARDRSDSTESAEAFDRASRSVESLLPLDDAPAQAAWFVYALLRADLVRHGFRLTDVWITDRGRLLLEALERY